VDRIGKLFLVLDAVNRRCLCCDGIFKRQQAPHHAQVPCLPATNTLTQKTSELARVHAKPFVLAPESLRVSG
jgi:hypothetical protein